MWSACPTLSSCRAGLTSTWPSATVFVCLGGEPDFRTGLKRHSVSGRSLQVGSGAGKLVRVAVGLEETPDFNRPTKLASWKLWSQCQAKQARPGWGWLQSKWITRGSFPGNTARHMQYSVFCTSRLYSVRRCQPSANCMARASGRQDEQAVRRAQQTTEPRAGADRQGVQRWLISRAARLASLPRHFPTCNADLVSPRCRSAARWFGQTEHALTLLSPSLANTTAQHSTAPLCPPVSPCPGASAPQRPVLAATACLFCRAPWARIPVGEV